MQDILLFGIQGSGKGTQAKKLTQNGYTLFETGAALRALSKENSTLGKKVHDTINAGRLVDTSLIVEIVADFIQKVPQGSPIVFDGLPRSIDQMNAFETLIQKTNREPKAIYLKLQKDNAISRVLSRFICEGVDSQTPEMTPDQCITLGGQVVRRKDDNEEALRARMEIFEKETLPVIDWYKSQNRLIEIDGSTDYDNVFVQIANALNISA